MKLYLNACVFLFFGLVSSGVWAQTVLFPPNQNEKNILEQIRSTREFISDLKSQKSDISDQRSNLMLRILKEDLQDKIDEATARKDVLQVAYLQKEMNDLQTLRDDIWAHSIKIREQNHQLEHLRVSLLNDLLDQAAVYFQNENELIVVNRIQQCQTFLAQASAIEDQKYELRQNATAMKEKDDFSQVPALRAQLDHLQQQYDQLIFDTISKMKKMGLDSTNHDLQSI